MCNFLLAEVRMKQKMFFSQPVWVQACGNTWSCGPVQCCHSPLPDMPRPHTHPFCFGFFFSKWLLLRWCYENVLFTGCLLLSQVFSHFFPASFLLYKIHDLIALLAKLHFYLPEESVTFNTLKGLKNRGVKVELGFPYEMWDTPDAEVTRLKSRVRIQIKKMFLQLKLCIGMQCAKRTQGL